MTVPPRLLVASQFLIHFTLSPEMVPVSLTRRIPLEMLAQTSVPSDNVQAGEETVGKALPSYCKSNEVWRGEKFFQFPGAASSGSCVETCHTCTPASRFGAPSTVPA